MWPASRAGGHSSIRRATPSISVAAVAGISLSVPAASTERPETSPRRSVRQVCSRIFVSDTTCRASEMVRPFRAGPRKSRSVKISRGGIFIGPDEVAYRERKGCVLRNGKRIDAEIVFKQRDQDGEA